MNNVQIDTQHGELNERAKRPVSEWGSNIGCNKREAELLEKKLRMTLSEGGMSRFILWNINKLYCLNKLL